MSGLDELARLAAGEESTRGKTLQYDPRWLQPVYADGKHVVVRPGAKMPPRCIHCNASADETVSKVFKWLDKSKIGTANDLAPVMAGILGGLVGAALFLALFKPKQSRYRHISVEYGLCKKHARWYSLQPAFRLVRVFGNLWFFAGASEAFLEGLRTQPAVAAPGARAAERNLEKGAAPVRRVAAAPPGKPRPKVPPGNTR